MHDASDLPDSPVLTLAALDFDHRIDTKRETDAALDTAKRILEYSGSTFRTNKNAAMLVVADGKTLTQARAASRTLAALTDISKDNQRLKRFNAEQKTILAKRLEAIKERLPQLVVMAYRHLVLLGGSNGEAVLDRVDLGPARVGATVSGRVLEYLRSADRLIDKLAPAALLAARFGLLAGDAEAVELDKLASQFARLTRLPKLSSPDVLRHCLIDGVRQRVFGLASGSDRRADDTVLRFGVDVRLDEVEFQPGTWLVRAKAIEPLVRSRQAEDQTTPPVSTGGGSGGAVAGEDATPYTPTDSPEQGRAASQVSRVRVTVKGVPPDKARDVVKVAVLPLSANSVSTSFDIEITAEGGASGISRETLDLVVLEGLRQLGLKVETEIE